MSKIFDEDSDTELTLQTDNVYAKNYDQWRKKEELNKLKTKYVDELQSNTSSSESDDDEGVELTEEIEKDFYKTLACLKNRDPRIYDEKVRFFDDKDIETLAKPKTFKRPSVYLKDYERNLILEKRGILSDEDDTTENKSGSPSYVEEQQQAKESLKKVLNSLEDDCEGHWGGMFTERKKTLEEKEKDESEYKMWLSGQKNEIEDDDIKKDLKPLKEYWNNPNLDEGEKFLRDFILKKQFLNKKDEDYIPTYEEIVHDSDELSNDEGMLEKQEEFEHKYNFRFEEQDPEFIKRYPRTMENSIRRKSDKRKQKRQEIKERKKTEKEKKMQDLKKLQELKRTEIEEKLEKLKEITGNTTLGFANQDIEGEFDPEQHDKRMQELFNDEYYEGHEGEQKPEFPDLDEELQLENWSSFYKCDNNESLNSDVHCEDENFNMDCEYDPKAAEQYDFVENTNGKKKRKRKSKFAEAVSKPKPKFDPSDKTYEEYFDEYYKLDCEDFIGDIPCRFKYRKVIPNDYGLSLEEIILAKEKELNKWCSLKKTVQIRPDHIEKYDQIAYRKKSKNLTLKKKILPSLFISEENDGISHTSIFAEDNIKTYDKYIKDQSPNEVIDVTSQKGSHKNEKKNKKRKKRIKKMEEIDTDKNSQDFRNSKQNMDKNIQLVSECTPKKKQKLESNQIIIGKTENSSISNFKSKKKNKNSTEVKLETSKSQNLQVFKKKQKAKTKGDKDKPFNKKQSLNESSLEKISDMRLSAYGIKAKKFKNKLKYKK